MTDENEFLLRFDKEDHLLSTSLCLPYIQYNPYPRIVGSVKGLICFCIAQWSDNTTFLLFNPSIGRFHAIPPPLVSYWELVGFGFDERTHDYNILLTIKNNSSYFIYSLNSNSWRSIIDTTPSHASMVFNAVVFTNGRFHWLAIGSRSNPVFIRVFDVKTETFGQITMIECLSTGHRLLRFTEFGESSVAVIEHHFSRMDENNIWVMKEYGSEESWIKLATIYLRHGFHEAVLGFRNEDEVLIKHSTTGCITSQTISNEQVRKVIHEGDAPPQDFTVHKYVPSLALLDRKDNVDVDVVVPTQTIVEISAPNRSTKRIKKSVAHESPASQKVARRSKRIKHRPAKYTDFI